ncbi:sigma 54-interacting transcriptional regulator [Deltaproteobacteria bacterium OttesenSCG-928-M10]|nr:sigma 54-interacting transcriptional regulator [Deltaproteobacteria bacterium OttesenSCG-928-M10]
MADEKFNFASKEQLNILLSALPLVAMVSGSTATVTDPDGCMIRSYNSKGEEVFGFQGAKYDLAVRCLKERKPLSAPAQYDADCLAWAIPVGPYVIVCTNTERVRSESNLKKAITRALPLIAKLIGGNASVLNKEGRRLVCFDAQGELVNNLSKSEEARQAIASKEPIFSSSITAEGALTAYIPITGDCCLAIDNEVSASKSRKLLETVKQLRYTRYSFEDIVGRSPEISAAINDAMRAADSRSTVLLSGETGTGKEIFAQSIHNAGQRGDKPFVALNCGALPATLIESQLFGYVDGAFTGAKKGGATGSFEQAAGGTIFLDEISEMDLNLQSKLLRVLQEKEVTRIGGSKPIKVDVRVIASTNKDLRQMAADGKFREDLFYRLNVIQINVPPLRHRKGDVEILANYFISKYNIQLGKHIVGLGPEAVRALIAYQWPGNVRELQNCIEYAMNMADSKAREIYWAQLPNHITIQNIHKKHADQVRLNGKMPTLDSLLAEYEREIIVSTLAKTKFRNVDTAAMLGISVTTLWRRMQKHGL